MAEICYYKIKVKGTKDACRAFVYTMPTIFYKKKLMHSEGTDNEFCLTFLGDYKNYIDWHTTPLNNPQKLTDEEIKNIIDFDYWQLPMRERATLLDCEVFCSSGCFWVGCDDIDGEVEYIHYDKNGQKIHDECPDELKITGVADFEEAYDSAENFSHYVQHTCLVKTAVGEYWCVGKSEVGHFVFTDIKEETGIVQALSNSQLNPATHELAGDYGPSDNPIFKKFVERIEKGVV